MNSIFHNNIIKVKNKKKNPIMYSSEIKTRFRRPNKKSSFRYLKCKKYYPVNSEQKKNN